MLSVSQPGGSVSFCPKTWCAKSGLKLHDRVPFSPMSVRSSIFTRSSAVGVSSSASASAAAHPPLRRSSAGRGTHATFPGGCEAALTARLPAPARATRDRAEEVPAGGAAAIMISITTRPAGVAPRILASIPASQEIRGDGGS